MTDFSVKILGEEVPVKYLLSAIFDENWELRPELRKLQEGQTLNPKEVMTFIQMGTGIDFRELDRLPDNMNEIMQVCVRAFAWCAGADLKTDGMEAANANDPLVQPEKRKNSHGKKSTK